MQVQFLHVLDWKCIEAIQTLHGLIKLAIISAFTGLGCLGKYHITTNELYI